MATPDEERGLEASYLETHEPQLLRIKHESVSFHEWSIAKLSYCEFDDGKRCPSLKFLLKTRELSKQFARLSSQSFT